MDAANAMTLIAPDGSMAFVPDAERTTIDYLLGMGYVTQASQQRVSVGGNRHDEAKRDIEGATGEPGQSGEGDGVQHRGQGESQDAIRHGSVAQFDLRADSARGLQQPDGEQRTATATGKGRSKPRTGNATKRKGG